MNTKRFSPGRCFTFVAIFAGVWLPAVARNAGMLWLPSATKIRFIGEPWTANNTGPLCLTYPAGGSFSSWFPQTICGLCETLEGSCPPWPDGTTVSKWNAANQAYEDYQ